MIRRDFIKSIAASLAIFTVNPTGIFIPPRKSFVDFYPGLNGLYSHLGMMPLTDELGGCEGNLIEIHDWDGTGYPCTIENACTFGVDKPTTLIYDFDLWNFRHDNHIHKSVLLRELSKFKNHNEWYAFRRFGEDYKKIAKISGGFLGN